MDHKQKQNRYFGMKSSLILPVLLVALTLCAVQHTIAYLIVTDQKVNTFSVGTVDGEIAESFSPDRMVKENVRVVNDGSVTAYVRAVVSIYWRDQTGMVLSQHPVEGIDYTINWGTDWLERDGIYYYPDPLGKDETTVPLISRCQQLADYDDQRILVVDIATQAIQANPSSAVTTAWNVTVDTTTQRIELPE